MMSYVTIEILLQIPLTILFPTYHKLTYHTTKPTKYNQIPITKLHVLLLGFAITIQKPTEIFQVSCKNQLHIDACKQWHKQSSTCKQ